MNPPVAMKTSRFGDMYSPAEIRHWADRYPEAIRWNYQNFILAHLSLEERRALAGAELRFPDTAPQEMGDSPLAFYAQVDVPGIVLPIFSIKFLDDLCFATAYLEASGFSQESVYDYLSFLKYGSPSRCPDGKFPPPLEALQIPAEELKRKDVENLGHKILKTSLVWVMGHEAGHLRFRHKPYASLAPSQAQDQEAQADAFATELFRRGGVLPEGALHLLMAILFLGKHRGDCPDDTTWHRELKDHTHPLSTTRMLALASHFRERPEDFVAAEPFVSAAPALFVASQIEGIATLCGDPDLNRLMRLRGLATSLQSLAPRPKNDPFAPMHAWAGIQKSEAPFEGCFEGHHARKLADGRTESLNACMLLHQQGERVQGRFSFGIGEGEIRGTCLGESLAFGWTYADQHGRGELRRVGKHRIQGVWGHRDLSEGGGSWELEEASLPHGA